MFPLFPFVAGIAAGVVGLRLAKNEKTRKSLSAAQDKLKEAGSSGMAAVQKLADKARARFGDADTEAPAKAPAKKTATRKQSAAASQKTGVKAAAKKSAAKKPTTKRTRTVKQAATGVVE